MSYRRAWLLVHGLNRSFTEPVTRASVGGRGGGGVQLTTLGTDLVRRYAALARRFDQLARKEFDSVASGPARQTRRRGSCHGGGWLVAGRGEGRVISLYSTVTLFARLRGWSTSVPFRMATWYASSCSGIV